jgi:hypothetical protein
LLLTTSEVNLMAEWKLRAALAQDLATADKLLESCELSADGARDQFGEGYVIAERQGELIGLAGVETMDVTGCCARSRWRRRCAGQVSEQSL